MQIWSENCQKIKHFKIHDQFWNQREKCIQMSINKPIIVLIILEIIYKTVSKYSKIGKFYTWK